MPIRVSNLRLGLDEPESSLPSHLAKVLGLGTEDIERWRILRKSLDARDKDDLQFVYNAEVIVPGDPACFLARLRKSCRPPTHIDLNQEIPFEITHPCS